MKVTYNWLRQYVDFNWSAEELSERLTMLGVEVEGVETRAGEFDKVVVAQILASDKHPNADKLSVCRVQDGAGERQIVCGAKNYKVGDKVPLALPGCAMPTAPGEQPFVIKASKMRGVESQGMLCSAKELGVAEDAEGLMILPENARVGQAFAEFLGRSAGDVVYDLEITPNRPDLNSVIGLAREISALTGNPLRIPSPNFSESTTEKAASVVNVRIEDPTLCPRYVARVVRGVTVGPSPAWLRDTLEKVGIRSINNVVDVTNYVMLEVGQPLHAFDLHLLATSGGSLPTIVVRRASEGEKFTTLDQQERTLSSEMLVIADETKAVALAGVMGGLNSEIQNTTRDVLIESAAFNSSNIRRTSKKLGLRTDASYRFERGSDIDAAEWASRRAAQLISELAGGSVSAGAIDAYPKPFVPRQITVAFARTDALLGISIPPAEQRSFLTRLSLREVASSDSTATYEVPPFRPDLKREADLIEEITRLFGIDKIPATPPRGALGSHPFDVVFDTFAECRRLVTALGLDEAQGQTLLHADTVRLVSVETIPGEPITLANPLSSDMSVLRASLLPGLLDSFRNNLNHKVQDVRLFELGRVFGRKENATREEWRIAFAITGQRNQPFWSGDDRNARLDIYDLKGLLDEFLEAFGMRGVTFQRRQNPTNLFAESATIYSGKQVLGEIGQVLPTLAKVYDFRDPVFVAELNLDLLMARRNAARSYKQLPAYPSSRRDVAMFVGEAVTHEAVLNAVKQAKPQFLERVDLFDIFRGKNVPEGEKSMAYAFTYRHNEKTLTDAEVNASHEKVVASLRTALGAAVRDV
ncbi:MAG TPA: phenylalanine--tRNA ligase subunit beta [Methylomirabilota bacterium]|nr:phenylalanine--tRNA ligase subunit beta [Methylomirabilota bacterium]